MRRQVSISSSCCRRKKSEQREEKEGKGTEGGDNAMGEGRNKER